MSNEEIVLRSRNKDLQEQYKRLSVRLGVISSKLSAVEVKDDSLYRSLLGVSPLDPTVRKAGRGGHSGTSAEFPAVIKNTAAQIEKLESRMMIEEKSLLKLAEYAARNQERMIHLPAIMPVSNKDLSYTGSGFGLRYHPILKIRRMHKGIDFIAPTGTEVYATAGGTISSSRISGTFGNVVEIDHGYGYHTLYAHLKRSNVKKGQEVKRGEVIGWVGNTGLSAGTHLHYEVHVKGKEVDPVQYFFDDLSVEQYQEIITKANSFEASLD